MKGILFSFALLSGILLVGCSSDAGTTTIPAPKPGDASQPGAKPGGGKMSMPQNGLD